MTFLGVFRGLEVGTDHAGYESDFYILDSIEDLNRIQHRFEIGYIYLILLFKKFSNDYLLFSGLTFLIPMIGTYAFIKKYNINYAWALFVFFFIDIYFASMNIMRQYMAICSIAAFTYLLKERKYAKFGLIVILFSVAFHQSSLIMILLIPIFYFFEQKQCSLSKKMLYILIIFSYLLFYIGPSILSSFVLILINVLPIDDSLNSYISEYGEKAISNATVSVYTLYALLLVYFNKSHKWKAEMMCFIFFIMAFNLFNMFTVHTSRVALPFKYYMISLVPLLISSNNNGSRRILILISIVFMFAVFFVSFIINNSGEINPYKTWL